MNFKNIPEPPGEKEWKFVEELQQPFHQEIIWEKQEAGKNEVSLKNGVSLMMTQPPYDSTPNKCEHFKLF